LAWWDGPRPVSGRSSRRAAPQNGRAGSRIEGPGAGPNHEPLRETLERELQRQLDLARRIRARYRTVGAGDGGIQPAEVGYVRGVVEIRLEPVVRVTACERLYRAGTKFAILLAAVYM